MLYHIKNTYRNTVFSVSVVVHLMLTLKQVFTLNRSKHRRCTIEKVVLKNFAKFTGKRLRQSLFFDKVAGRRATS